MGGSIVVSPLQPQPVITAVGSKDGKENQQRKDHGCGSSRKERKHNQDKSSSEEANRSQDEDLRPALVAVPSLNTSGISPTSSVGAGAAAALVTSELSSLTESMRRGRKSAIFTDYIKKFIFITQF